jgi:phage tail sheath gpL-like
MTVVSNPVVNITKAPASQTISNAPQKVLIIGQQTGTFYTSGQLIEEIGNANVEIGNIGKGSHLAEMVRAFKNVNEVTRVDAIPLDDAGGAVDATGTIAFTGTATEAGTITVYIGSRKNHAYSIAVWLQPLEMMSMQLLAGSILQAQSR